MRDRGSAVLMENNKVVLIKRVKPGSIYYVFPGGGIENGETPEQATIREAYEELGVKIRIKEYLTTIDYNGSQHFYLADILEGEIGTGQGEEFTDSNRDRGTYEPMWVDLNKLPLLNVKPREVAERCYDKRNL